ncbi:MAG: hypothetical protein QOK16_3440 [Solirubrobacteraceae bacterium]|nr:hypothetical protein [Solirubrobacteraceae bacterium]
MPVLETVVVKVAGSVATSVTRQALARAGERMVGSGEQRAFKEGCRKAIKKAAEDMLHDEQISEDEVVHVLELLDIIVTSRGPDSVLWLDGGDDSPLADWVASMHAQGLDASTLPALVPLVERVRAAIPSFLWEEGKRDGNPLFNRITLEALDVLVKQTRSLQERVASLVAASVPMAPFVQDALEAALARCRSNNVRFFTPHVLVALLDIEGGRVQPCVSSLDRDLARVMVERLRNYVRRYDAGRQPFRAFSWTERDDIKRAQQIATDYGLCAIDDLCLFVAVLEGGSRTVTSLENLLGPGRFRSLRSIAERSIGNQEYGRTDGEAFGTES